MIRNITYPIWTSLIGLATALIIWTSIGLPLLSSTTVANAGPSNPLTTAAWSTATYQASVGSVLKNYQPPVSDDFSNPSSGWPVSDDTIATRRYLNGEYQILIKQPDYIVSAGRQFLAGDFRVEVDARPAGSLYGSTGFYFGQTDAGYYLFDTGYGQFRLLRRDFANDTWTALIAPTPNPAIKTGSQTNRLKVVRRGTTITLYANDQQLGQVNDGTLGVGYVGLAASADAANYDARFDNFLLDDTAIGASTQGNQAAHASSSSVNVLPEELTAPAAAPAPRFNAR